MGCDIHVALEKRVDDQWAMVTRVEGAATNRNYGRFAALAGVRGPGPEQRGFPGDASVSIRLYRDEWGVNGHSDSWLPLREACEIFARTESHASEYAREYPSDYFFEVYDALDDYRIVFWFDS